MFEFQSSQVHKFTCCLSPLVLSRNTSTILSDRSPTSGKSWDIQAGIHLSAHPRILNMLRRMHPFPLQQQPAWRRFSATLDHLLIIHTTISTWHPGPFLPSGPLVKKQRSRGYMEEFIISKPLTPVWCREKK